MDEVLHRLSTLFQALGDGIRLLILTELREEPQTVSDLVDRVSRPHNAVSRHLRILRDYDLVESETKGRNRVYAIKRT